MQQEMGSYTLFKENKHTSVEREYAASEIYLR